MTWSSAKNDARRYIAAILEQVAAAGAEIKGLNIRLTDFEDEDCYFFLKGIEKNVWSFEYHRMVTRAIKRELSRLGARAEVVTIFLKEYWAWLESQNLNDATEHRARFILEKTNEKN